MAIRWILFDWGDTLMSEDGPPDIPMALWPEVRVLDGAREILTTLAATHRIAIATNASVSNREMVETALARAGLADGISELFCYRDLGVKKSDPAFWDVVVARLGVGRDELLMVGDDLEQDVLSPRRCGIDAVWFNWKGRSGEGGQTIGALAELPPLIAARGS